MPTKPKIILMTLGDELLLGLTQNTHLTYVGEQLRKGGATLHANITVSDHPDEIAQHFGSHWDAADVLITTGGLGPTVDDRTKEVIGQALGEALVFDADIQAEIEQRFKALGLTMTENNRKQAFRYESAIPLPNAHGTAPGLWLEKDGKTLIMLPGPPRELRPMFEAEVLPRMRERGWLQSGERYLQIRTIGVGESMLETRLQPILQKRQDVEVAYCAHTGQVDFRLSFPDDERADELLALSDECKELLGADLLCIGDDDLPKVVFDLMRQRQSTVATAESCSGGALASAFTDLSGASQVFVGGTVSYSEEAKQTLLGVPIDLIQKHGVVSEEVAMAMASGAAERLGADYALSATGYAGPNGGTPENPVGTVYIGLHSPEGCSARRLFYKTTRAGIKERVTKAALDWLRRELLNAAPSVADQPKEMLRSES